MVDFLAIAVVLAFTLRGYLRGILYEMLSVCALVAAYYAGVVPAPHVAGVVLRLREMPPGVAYVIGRVFASVLVFCSLIVAVRLTDKRVGRSRHGEVVPWNRNLGALAGLLFGAALAFWVLCLVDVAYKVLPGSDNVLVRAAEASHFRAWVSPNNPADRFLITDSLKFVRILHERPDAMDELKERPEIRELLNEPAIRDVLNDEELMADIKALSETGAPKLLMRIVAHEKIRKLLTDSSLRKTLLSRQVRSAVTEVVKEAEGAEPLDVPSEAPSE